MFVNTWGAVGSGAGAERDASFREVAQEVVPFGVGGFAVFAAGALCSSSRDEGLMVFNDVAVVDSDVALRGV